MFGYARFSLVSFVMGDFGGVFSAMVRLGIFLPRSWMAMAACAATFNAGSFWRLNLHDSDRLVRSVIHFGRRGPKSLLVPFVVRRGRRLQVIEIITGSVTSEDFGRDHLRMDLAAVIAQLKIIHRVQAERCGEREWGENRFSTRTPW